MTVCGYGVMTGSLQIHDLKKFIKDNDPDTYNDILDDFDDEPTEEQVQEWVDYSEYNGYTGLAPYIANVISIKEDVEFAACDFPAAIFVPSLFPWQFTDKMKNISQEQADSLLMKYLSKITDDEFDVGYMEFETD